MKKSLVLFFFLLGFVNCSTANNAFDYTPTKKNLLNNQPQQNLTIAVSTFKDVRGNENNFRALLVMLPGFFCSTSNLDRPEMLYYKMTPKDDFPKALADELDSYEYFKEVFYSTRKFPLDTDYIIHGKIISTKNELIAYGYGLGVFSVYLLFFGAPMYKSKNFIEVELELIKAKTKEVVLKRNYKYQESNWISLYYNLATMGKGFNEISKKIFPEFAKETVEYFQKNKI